MDNTPKKQTTADKILNAAEDLFIDKGFSSTSINDIANKAKIHKSLIYHHYQNKEGLWKSVKRRLLQTHMGTDLTETNFPKESFKKFLQSFVTMRFDFYDQNPSIARLISWQRLEKEKEELEGIKEQKFSILVPHIKEFQQRGEIRQNLDPEMVEYLIMSISSLPFMDKPTFFEGSEAQSKKKRFLDLIIESLYLTLSPEEHLKNLHSTV